MLHGSDARALCNVTGIKEVMLFPRAPEGFRGNERGFSWGDPATAKAGHCEGLEHLFEFREPLVGHQSRISWNQNTRT
jgi:hypothetical protein